MHGESKLFQKLFGEKLGNRCDLDMTTSHTLVAFEQRLVRSIKDEERVDVEGKESQESIVKGSQSRIRAALSSLNLEEPYTDINSKAQRS